MLLSSCSTQALVTMGAHHALVLMTARAASAAEGEALPLQLVLTHRRTRLQDALHAEACVLGATAAGGEWGLYGWREEGGSGRDQMLS